MNSIAGASAVASWSAIAGEPSCAVSLADSERKPSCTVTTARPASSS